ncbi:MAG: hypothetical protein WC712_06950 [Candidatus Brocadiia bacterium]
MAPIVEKVLKTRHGTLTLTAAKVCFAQDAGQDLMYFSMPLESVVSCKIARLKNVRVIVEAGALLFLALVFMYPYWIPFPRPILLGAIVGFLFFMVTDLTKTTALVITSYGRERIVAKIKGSDVEVMIGFIEAVEAAKLACKKAQPAENPPLA